MDEHENTVRRITDDGEVEKRTATEIIVGLGGPAIIAAGTIGAKFIETVKGQGKAPEGQQPTQQQPQQSNE